METLTSIEYANLIGFLVYRKYGEILNKLQINFFLFCCYGLYLVDNWAPLFDEIPLAWACGPVFPKVYKHYQEKEPLIPEKMRNLVKNDKKLSLIIQKVVEQLHSIEISDLYRLMIEEGTPWNKTIFGKDGKEKNISWSEEIKREYIIDYFKMKKKEILVFESDECGYHTSKTGKLAKEKYGAEDLIGVGYHGQSYAIPTLDMFGDKLSIDEIKFYINNFIDFAERNSRRTFLLSKIGTEKYGMTDKESDKLFDMELPKNVKRI
jgi:uncharacterized phage-associated protein